MISRDHWQGVQLTGEFCCPGDGIVELHSLCQCLLSLAAVMTMVDSPPWSKQSAYEYYIKRTSCVIVNTAISVAYFVSRSIHICEFHLYAYTLFIQSLFYLFHTTSYQMNYKWCPTSLQCDTFIFQLIFYKEVESIWVLAQDFDGFLHHFCERRVSGWVSIHLITCVLWFKES